MAITIGSLPSTPWLERVSLWRWAVVFMAIWFRRNKVLYAAGLVRWQPPPIGTVKVNIDVAVDVSSLLVGFGMVVRDSSG
ncbi:hypothetical protein ACOSQ4_014155 [Xanthoceras sorbifolium]